MRWIFGVVVCLGLLVGILRSASPVYAQYPTATPVVATCTGQSNCKTQCYGYGSNNCGPTQEYCETLCSTLTQPCNSGCAASTTCNATNSNYYCKYNIGCSWFPANDCQGGTCGCGQLRVAVRYCSSVHCDDACSANSSCGTCTGGGGAGGGPVPTTAPTSTPIPFVTIKARAVQVTPANTTCAAIKAVPVTAGQVTGTIHQFTPSSTTQPLAQAQAGADYVTFLGLYAGPYTLDPIPPNANWMFARPCWTNETTGATGEGLSQTLAENQTLRWDIGYTLGTAWVQTQGADVYAAGSVRSYIPDVTPRVFMAAGTGRSAGVLQYGTSYDFDSSPYAVGNNLVSSGNWQVSGGKPTVDYYDYFYRRYGAPTVPTTNAAFSNLTAVTKPASSATPYYVTGNMTTSGNWVVGTGESIVILVNGNLTIGGKINTTGTGFIAFIVNGNITVADTVGTTWSSTTPVVEGVYIATKADQSG